MDPGYLYNLAVGRLRRAIPDRHLDAVAARFDGLTAIEVGGPSPLFGKRGTLPVYSRLAEIDLCNYATGTLWSSTLDGLTPRRSFVCEATSIGVDDGSYDALIASHVLEHVADPLGALGEWRRVVRPGGLILLVAPHRDGTFDHRRPPTTIEHLRSDARAGRGEDDRTHLEEILRLHDLGRDPLAGNEAQFAARSRENFVNRALHHHVFDTRTLAAACAESGLEVIAITTRRPYHIIVLAERPRREGGRSVRGVISVRFRSPFRSDHRASAIGTP